MSGRKTTYTRVSEDELRRLRKEAAQATDLRRNYQLMRDLNERNAEALADYERRINAMTANIGRLNQQIEGETRRAGKEAEALRAQLQRMVKESNDRLQAEAQRNQQNIVRIQQGFQGELSRTRADFSAAIDQVRADSAAAIDANNRRIEAAMAQQNQRVREEMQSMEGRMAAEVRDLRDQIDAVESAIGVTAHDQSALCDMAREYAQAARVLNEDTRNNYRTELLCPGRLKPVLDQLSSAEREIQDAEKYPVNAPVARLAARQALEAAFQLHQDVICAENEWNLHYQAARQMLDTAQVQIAASRTLELSGEGNAAVDVDHWTDGDLSAISARLTALMGQLDQPEGLSVADLDGIQAAGTQISREVDVTSAFAVEAFYSSQDRGEIAQDISDQLREFGLEIAGHSYQGGDQRSAHRLHLRNAATGFELVITQTPVVGPDGTLSNQLESDILNYGTFNEARGDELARGVLGSLSDLGFVQGQVETVPGYEHASSDRRECADILAWRGQKNPDVARPVHRERRAAGQ